MKLLIIIFLISLFLIAICACLQVDADVIDDLIPDHILYGHQLNQMCPERSCCMQARLYADFLGDEAVVMSNGEHAFVVLNEKIFDSTCMRYNGFPINSWRIERVYGKWQDWKKKANVA